MTYLKNIAAIIVLTIFVITSSAIASPYANSRAIVISGGEDHTLVLTADANLWACGDNYWYQLGVGDDKSDRKLLVRVHGPNGVNLLEDIIAMDSGWKHSLAVDINNNVLAWGNNEEGELGNAGEDPYKTAPVLVHGPGDVGFLENIVAVSAGRSGEHSLALDNSNHVWSFGRNDCGQLGDGTPTTPRTTPVAVHAGQQNPANPNAALADIVQISAGEMTSIALEKIDANDPNYKGRVLTWGSNKWPIDARYPSGKGKLGNGDITADSCDLPVLVLRGAQPGDSQYLERIVAVSAGWDHTMALEDFDPFELNCLGRVFTFGNNGQGYGNDEDPCSVGGRLGDGTYNDANVPVMVVAGEQNPAEPTSALKNIVAISAGEGHSMALDYQGHVFCWGDNYFGQLGNGTTNPSTTPVQVLRADNDEPLSNIVAISAAYWHNLAIDVNGTIWTWGKSADGRLGLGHIPQDLATKARPIPVVFNLNKNSYHFGIQTAIDDANNGNVLEAQPGTYFENIDFQGKTLTLTSTDPFDEDVVERTVIYGARYDPNYAATVNIQECTDSVLTGLTITNADDAIVCDGSSAAITNCIVTNNKYRGIYSSNCEVNIINCLINHNDELGIYCKNGDVNVAWSLITGNAEHGIHTWRSPNINIANSIIADNGGNGVFLEDCVFSFTAEVVNNWIYNNGTSSGGAGLDVYFPNKEVYDQAVVRNNTIVNNATYGINLFYAQDAIIDNCIVYNNGDSASDNIHKDGGAPFYVSFSCVEGSFTGTGNIDDDPCFADPNWTTDPNANNFHIGPNSLCIDVGDSNFIDPNNETDIDGEDRVIFGRTALRVDMGADELYWPKCDYDGSEIVNFVDFTFFANAWQTTNTTIDLDDDNFVDINDLILFCNDWLWVAPWSARYEQMSMAGGSGGRTMDSQTAIAAPTQAPGFMPGVHPTAPAQSEPLSAERIEELIDWTESLLEDEERTLDESKIQIILNSLKSELPD